MTFVDETSKQTDIPAPAYPTAFGITFTPLIIGSIIGVLGLLGAIWYWMNFGAPSLTQYNKLKIDENSKQQDLDLAKNGNYQRKVAQAQKEIIEAKKLQETAYSLFANEQSGNTILLDINKLVKARKAVMKEFTPDNKSVVVSDGSLGPLVNNKLKRQGFSFNIEGNFLDFHELMRDIEKLQPLLLVKNFKAVATVPEGQEKDSELNNRILFDAKYKDGKLTFEQVQKSRVKTSFRLDLISPLTANELPKPKPAPSASP